MGVYPLFFFSLHLFYSHHFFAGLLHRWPSQACWLLWASGSLFWPYLPQAKINNPGGNTALPKKHQQVSKKKSSLWLEVQHLHWSLQWQGWQPAHASCFFHWAGLQRGN
jgi:hypothetical protein